MSCVPIRGYLNLELRSLLLAINNGALGVRGLDILSHCVDYAVCCSAYILVQLDAWAQSVWIAQALQITYQTRNIARQILR